MNNIKVGAASLNQIPMDWSGNQFRIMAAIKEAINEKVTLLLLPELCISGYGCEDAFFSQDVQFRAKNSLKGIIEYIKCIQPIDDITISVGLPYFYNGAIYNVSALINDCGVIAYIPKQNLANDGVHYEGRWFRAWESGKLIEVKETIIHQTRNIPFGDTLIDFKGIKVGYEICQDAWVSNRPGINHAQHGVDIILNPSASHFAFGKHAIRERFIKEGSRAFKCAYVYANLLGNESGSSIFEGDTEIAIGGEIIASGKRLSFQNHILTTAVIDIDDIRTTQSMDGSYHPKLDEYNEVLVNYSFKSCEPKRHKGIDLKAEEWDKNEEFNHAEALALFDYMRKSHSNGYCLSLSGGADSTACAILIKLMHDFGIAELGKREFIIKSGMKFSDKENLMKQLLTCIYQGTVNSSQETFNSAKTVAEAIGSTFLDWQVDNMVDEYKHVVQRELDIDLSWENNDIALQNIQARVRIPGLWMVANIKNALLICTSNRSEAAVGYSTADGDLSGSLSPLAGIDKHFLLSWLNWMYCEWQDAHSNEYYRGSDWIHALRHVLDLQPSAELRPADNKQTDEQDLMPYEFLDFIERKAIVQKKSPRDIFEHLKLRFSSTDHELLRGYVNKFFKLWSKNQWKRHKQSVSFMLDEECLDPKTFCRFPILSASFEEI
jgi:NAD+ synthase (glutamine-hydrolysing)